MYNPAVRLLVMLDQVPPRVVTHCQLWFDSLKDPVTAKVAEYKHIWNNKWFKFQKPVIQVGLVVHNCQL